MELRVEGINKRFGGIAALQEVTLTAPSGRVLGIIGPNGSGKSTLFNVISGFLRADDGEVLLDGARITDRTSHEIARAGLVRSFQVPAVARRLTVMDNIMFGAPAHRESVTASLFGRRRRDALEREALERAHHVAGLVGLASKTGDYAGDLSGGQLKLLSLGIVMMAQPRVLLLDEPTAGINPALIGELIGPIFDERPAHQTVVLIEHNMELVTNHCEHVYVLDAGAVIADGGVDEVRKDARVIEAYLGREAAHT